MSEQPLKVIAGATDRPLVIGEFRIQCYVLENEIRVLTQGGFLTAIGRSRTPKAGTGGLSGVDQLPFFLRSENLKPFISNELIESTKPIIFHIDSRRAVGYDAKLLPQVCEVYLKAKDAGVLQKRQLHIAARCDVLIRGLATIGIIALVDEVTEYEKVRARNSLATILEKFIAKELQPWTKTFPFDFYLEIARLRGWPPTYAIKRPSVVAKYTNNFVYGRIAPGLLEELRRKNPTIAPGRRKAHHHQWFTPEHGHPRLREHLAAVIALLRAAPKWSSFERSINRAFPVLNVDVDLPLDYDD